MAGAAPDAAVPVSVPPVADVRRCTPAVPGAPLVAVSGGGCGEAATPSVPTALPVGVAAASPSAAVRHRQGSYNLTRVWDELLAASDYRARVEAAAAFNAQHAWRKRALKCTPVR